MARIGFHASHELYPPSRLLALLRLAEQAGFTAAMSSDHFHPWSERHGQSGFAWAWLGAVLAQTALPFGVVSAPGQRYHPAIVAQAAATLAEMFPGRFWLALGSGEALNEHITGERWPAKAQRNARLRECADVIRALWRGETVEHAGRVRVHTARLYTRPAEPPPLYGAAITEPTAEWLAAWADGLITVGATTEALKGVLGAFERGGGRGKPRRLQAALSWGASETDALAAAHERWRHAGLDVARIADIATPEEFDAATRDVTPQALRGALRISADLDQHRHWLERDLALGFDEVHLNYVGADPERFVRECGERLLPHL